MQHEDEKYYSLVRITRSMVLGIQNEVDFRTAVNCLMNGIFKLPSIKTGLVSKEALNLPSNKRTPEHFYGRTESAKRFIKEIKENPNRSDSVLVMFLKSRSRIHYVTKTENMALRSYSKKNPKTHWRKAYRDCGIELVKNVVQTNQKYVYKIEEVIYNNVKDILDKYDINYSTLYSRCNAKRKWQNWNKIEKEV